MACDDGAIHGRLDAVSYAEQLLVLARSARGPVPALPIVRLFGRSLLSSRIRSILDEGKVRSPLSRSWLLLVLCVLTAGAIPLATVDLLEVAQTPDEAALHLERLVDPDPEVRRRAAWSLGELEDRRGVPGLVETLRDSDPRVRVMSAWALGEIKDRESAPALVARLGDPDSGVREMVVLALGEIQDPSLKSTVSAVSSQPGLRGPVVWALEEISDDDPPPVWAGELQGERPYPPDLQVYLQDLKAHDADTRSRAAEKLGRLGDSVAVVPLMDALSDPEPTVRAMATWALDEINPTRNPSPGSWGSN
jgi:HEAT repeat protein